MARLHKPIVATVIALQMTFAASLLCFPLFSLQLRRSLGLNLSQLNSVYVFACVGQYLSAAFAGSLADRRGPALLSFIAAVSFGVGYGFMALALSRSIQGRDPAPIPSPVISFVSFALSNWVFIASYYTLVGIATTFAYFSSLTTACKTWPNHSGLSIGIASSLFGLSPLFLSQIAYSVFTPKHQELDAVAFLKFLGITLGIVYLLCSIILHIYCPTKPETASTPSETSPLLPTKTEEDAEVKHYLKSAALWQLGALFFLSIGPVEMLGASLGSIVESLLASSTSTSTGLRTNLVQVMAFGNTITRLSVGAISDYICPTPGSEGKRRVSRLVLFSGMSTVFAVVLISAAKMRGIGHLYVVCLIAGIANGWFSTIIPSAVANKFSASHFGEVWGYIASTAGFSGMLFNELYAALSDLEGRRQESEVCLGHGCYRTTMLLSAASVGIAAVLSLYMSRKRSWKRV